MAKSSLRPINVDGENYLWALKHYHDIWAGTLVVYAAESKKGRLEVCYSLDKYFAWGNASHVIVDDKNPERSLNIHEPEPTARMIRYACDVLGWNPIENPKPLFIADGFEILKNLGYSLKPILQKDE